MRDLRPFLTGVAFVAAGVLHFKYTRTYERIVPPAFPAQRELVLISGACEILGGLGTLAPNSRRYAGYGLVALLVAVFPANVYMALDAPRFAPLPAWALYARLPLQFVLTWWVYVTCINRSRS